MTDGERLALREAAAKAREADDALVDAMRAARAAGVSWADVATDAGLTLSAARWRLDASGGDFVAQRRWDGERAAETHERLRLLERTAMADSAPLGTESVTVAEAAALLRVTRPTIYAWIREGRVDVIGQGRGRRVAVDPDTGSVRLGVKGTFA